MTEADDPDRLLAVLRDAVDLRDARPLHVVVHAGTQGHPEVLQQLVADGPVRLTLVSGPGADLSDLRSVVLEHGADAGAVLAGGRVHLLDERGEAVPPSTVRPRRPTISRRATSSGSAMSRAASTPPSGEASVPT